EWAWNDHYLARALAWGEASPGAAALYLLEKARVVLFEVRPVPRVGGGGALRSWVITGSFLLLRGALLGALVLAWRARGRLRQHAALSAFAAAASLALCVPLLVGFAYD